MPGSSRVVAYFGDDGLTVPSGDTRASAGNDVLILARSELIDDVEAFISPRSVKPGKGVPEVLFGTKSVSEKGRIEVSVTGLARDLPKTPA